MKHMVEYLLPGTLVNESSVRELSERSADEARALAPPNAFAFTLYEVEDAPDLGPDFTVLPKPKNRSGRYYIGGEIFTLRQVEAMGHGFETLAANMSINRWGRVVRCRTGNWQPLEADDVVLA